MGPKRVVTWRSCILLCTAFMLLPGCSPPTQVERIRQEGVLHMVALKGPLTYAETSEGPVGFEFELASAFARDLGVSLRVRPVEDIETVYRLLEEGHTDIAATGKAVEAISQSGSPPATTDPYYEFEPVVIYRKGSSKPRKLVDLTGKHMVVGSSTAHNAILERIRDSALPDLNWQVMEDSGTRELMRLVDRKEVDLAVVNSLDYSLQSAMYPQVGRALSLPDKLHLAWLLSPDADPKLVDLANTFLADARTNGTIQRLQDHYYSHIEQLDYVGARTFMQHIESRLPKFRKYFEQAAREHGLDWRLLAAIGYQESHWRPYATSPTGVRGLMMLTRAAAQEVGIANRLDAEQSIHGGAIYFSRTYRRLPASVREPHRTWFALAAYNVGYGHLLDARQLTVRQDHDPDRWEDVRKHLPLLQKPEWYKTVRYGYARGWEPVHYVQNIRRFYQVLRWKFPPPAPQPILLRVADSSAESGAAGLNSLLPAPFSVAPPVL